MGCESSMEVKARADGGDMKAQYRYARCIAYQDGTIIYLKMAGQQGHKRAAEMLGHGYCYGPNLIISSWEPIFWVHIDHVEANKWYRIADNQAGIERTQYAVDRRDKILAQQKQAELKLQDGSPESLYKIGVNCIVAQDHKEGIRLLIMSAKQGYKEAANQLGYIYGYQTHPSRFDASVDIDMEESYKYFKMAKNTEEMSKIATILSVENQTDELQKLRQENELLRSNQTIVPSAPPSYSVANV